VNRLTYTLRHLEASYKDHHGSKSEKIRSLARRELIMNSFYQLASKLASANGGQSMPPGGAPPYPTGGQQYPPQGIPPPPGGRPVSGGGYPGQPPPGGRPVSGGGYPGQQQYQAYNPQGQPPPMQQQGYGAPSGYGQPPPQQGGASVAQFRSKLEQAIQENGLTSFYQRGSPQVEQIAQKAATQIPALAQRWRVPMEIAVDLCQIGLYDVIIFIDDSGSMAFEENGERISDLKLILERVASVATIFDDDGVSLRFMNANYQPHLLENIKTEAQIQQLMSSVQYKGLTPMGTELRKKVLEGIIFPKMRQGQMQKPFLVIAITDGQPAGEPAHTVSDTLKTALNEVRSNFPANTQAITFQFAQVGNDQAARNFLAKLDEDPQFGSIVDCTSSKFHGMLRFSRC
jgi:hypothetical protein